MAEKGAHLTGTALIKPSLFEIIAQQSLATTLEPAFQKVFSFLITCNPERYEHLLRWADEAYLIFNTVLQKYYFNKHSASFSETFYGLKRVPITNPLGKQQMGTKQQRLSLILYVLFPYIKGKLVKLSQQYRYEASEGNIGQSESRKRYQSYFSQICTVIFMLYESLVLYNYILYLSGKSVYPTPFLRLISVTLTYAEDHQAPSVSELLRKIKSNSFGLSDGIEILQRTVTTSIEFGAFFLQFLSWWNQEDNYSSIMNLPVPPPPKVPETAAKYKGICPVCLKPPRIKTVLSVSGYMFCYQCILVALRNTGRCPVTNYPAQEDDLIRLYI